MATGRQGAARSPSSRPRRGSDFAGLEAELAEAIGAMQVSRDGPLHACRDRAAARSGSRRRAQRLAELRPAIRIMGAGEAIEIYKEVGLPERRGRRASTLAEMTGTHGIGHTRMATESAVTTLGAHPFSTGADQCLVHNGSLSNHNNVRRELIRDGMTFETENDTEVAAAYLTSQMAHGKNLGEALEDTLEDLDGFFTFVVGTKTGFGVRARPDRLQAGRAGRDRPVRRLRLGVPRARRPAGHRGGQGLGAGAGNRLFLGALNAAANVCGSQLAPQVFDLARRRVRELNQALHRSPHGSNETAWEVLNPEGQPCGRGRRRRARQHRCARQRRLLLRRHEQRRRRSPCMARPGPASART